jgi:hypothetical protein
VFATADAINAKRDLLQRFIQAYQHGTSDYQLNFLNYDDGGDFIPGPEYTRPAQWRQRDPLKLTHLEIFTGVAIEVILSLSIWGARLRWAARADDEPTATEGGDPSDTYKRWFDRVSGRAGWWRGSSLVGTSYWPGGHEECAQALPRARSGPTDGRSEAVAARMTLSP